MPGGNTIDLTVRQGEVSWIGYVSVEVCDGRTQAWEAEVTTFGVPGFKRGPARASASGLVHARDAAGQDVQLQVDLQDKRITIRR